MRYMKQAFLSGSFGVLISLILLIALPAEAATRYVTVNGPSFSPATLTIAPGDTVVWENTEDFFPHTTTSDLSLSDPNCWDGLLVGQGDTFDHTFNSPGTFTYHDKLDSGTGTITVSLPAPTGIVLESARQEGSQFLFAATGLTAGKTNVLQASTNLTSWVAVTTNVANNPSLTFTNATTLPARFFRVVELP
jgi:plastocyanin